MFEPSRAESPWLLPWVPPPCVRLRSVASPLLGALELLGALAPAASAPMAVLRISGAWTSVPPGDAAEIAVAPEASIDLVFEAVAAAAGTAATMLKATAPMAKRTSLRIPTSNPPSRKRATPHGHSVESLYSGRAQNRKSTNNPSIFAEPSQRFTGEAGLPRGTPTELRGARRRLVAHA